MDLRAKSTISISSDQVEEIIKEYVSKETGYNVISINAPGGLFKSNECIVEVDILNNKKRKPFKKPLMGFKKALIRVFKGQEGHWLSLTHIHSVMTQNYKLPIDMAKLKYYLARPGYQEKAGYIKHEIEDKYMKK